MRLVRTLAVLPLAAVVVLAAAGCKQRGARADSPEQPSAGSSSQQAQINELTAQRDQAREELEKNKSGTVGDQAQGLGIEGLGEGFTATGNGRISLGEDFAFERGSANLNSEGRKAVEKLALRLNDGDSANHLVVVEGHTDDQPVSRPHTVEMYTDNWGLSAARSASVVRALQKAGVKAERLRGSFRGQYAPAVTGGKKDDKGANRRVEIYLAK